MAFLSVVSFQTSRLVFFTMLCIIDIKGVTTITMEELVLLKVLNTSGRRAKQRLLPYAVGKITK